MKRVFILWVVFLILAGRWARAQEAAPAAPASNSPAPTNNPVATTADAATNPPALSAAPVTTNAAAPPPSDGRCQPVASSIQALHAENESLKAKIAAIEQSMIDLRQQQAADNSAQVLLSNSLAASGVATIGAQRNVGEQTEHAKADIQSLQEENASLNAKIASLGQSLEEMRQQQSANNSTLQKILTIATTSGNGSGAGNAGLSAAAMIAAQQVADERYQRTTSDMQALQQENESLKAKITTLEQTVADQRQQQAAASNFAKAEEDLKRLAEKIAEVDAKREADKQAISEEIRKSVNGLEKTLAAAPPVRPAPVRSTPDPEPAQIENGFSYTIQSGDSLSLIVKAYNADFKTKGWKPITIRQAEEANPGVKEWKHVKVGQKIIIPRPEGQ